MTFCVWLLLLSIMFSRSIPVRRCLHISSLLRAESCCIVSRDHDSILHPSVDGPFGCVYLLVVVNSAAMDVYLFEYQFSVPLGIV